MPKKIKRKKKSWSRTVLLRPTYLPVGSTQMRPQVLSFRGYAEGMVLTDCTKRRVGVWSPLSRPLAACTLYSYTLTVEDSSFTTYAEFTAGWKALTSREGGGGAKAEEGGGGGVV